MSRSRPPSQSRERPPLRAVGDSPPPPARRRRRGPELATLAQCRREASKLYRDARRGDVDVQDAARLAHVLSVVLRAAIAEREIEAASLTLADATRLAGRLADVIEEHVRDCALRKVLFEGFRVALGEARAAAGAPRRTEADDDPEEPES